MSREYTVIIEQDSQGYYVADVPELRGCHTQARSLDELMSRVKEAIQVCIEAYGDEAPESHLIGVQKVAV